MWFLNLVYTSAPLMRCTICVWCLFGTRLINFPRTWGEWTPVAWKGHLEHRTVCEPFADGAVQVRSPILPYAHLVCESFGVPVYTSLYVYFHIQCEIFTVLLVTRNCGLYFSLIFSVVGFTLYVSKYGFLLLEWPSQYSQYKFIYYVQS